MECHDVDELFSIIYFVSLLLHTQVKNYRALQEQASTYLDLVCSVCDLSDDAVRVAAAQVQHVKLTVSETNHVGIECISSDSTTVH